MPKDLGVDEDLIPPETITAIEREVDVLGIITGKARARRRGEAYTTQGAGATVSTPASHPDRAVLQPARDSTALQPESKVVNKKEILQERNIARKKESKPDGETGKVRRRQPLEIARKVGEGPLITVTFRLPAGATEWLVDCQYRFRHCTRLSKQDLIKLALQLLAAEVEMRGDLPDIEKLSERMPAR